MNIVVAGAGMVGSAAAMMLARDGHQVTVLDRDGAPPPSGPDAAWTDWSRRAVGQFRGPHLMLARGTQILRHELPDVSQRMVDNGALRLNAVEAGSARIPGATAEPDDERFTMITGRRPMLEWVMATSLAAEAGVTVRRDTAIDGLLADTARGNGAPHVTGVALAGAEHVAADVVIDATGRRSPSSSWLAAIGARSPIEHSEDSGFVYCSRFYRSADGSVPPFYAPGLSDIGSISVLCIPADNGTWSVTLYAASDDALLRRVRDVERFEAVIRACPAHAHWLHGEPISEVTAIAGTTDQDRAFVLDGQPVATGMLSVGDAWACTNPSLGRGMSMGLMHAVSLRDLLRDPAMSSATPTELALQFHERTQQDLAPWHDATRRIDRARAAQMHALAAGETPAEDPVAAVGAALGVAAAVDQRSLRYLAELQGCLALPNEVFGRPGAFQHVLDTAAGVTNGAIPGPDRAALVTLLS